MTDTPEPKPTDDLFSDESSGTTSPPLATDPLKELVGEDKPFKTVEALAKGKAEADSFIERLKKENSEMRETLSVADKKVAEATTMDAIMERIRKATKPEEPGNQPTALTSEDIQKLVAQETTTLDNAKQAQANKEVMQARLLKHFGNDTAKARVHVEMRAKELGVTPSSIRDTAATSPKSALTLLGIEEERKAPGSGPAHSLPGAHSDNPLPAGSTRNFRYYNEMRKKLGTKFFATDIQQQKMRDIETMGEDAFYKD